jgi:hypothetical protein
VPVKVVAIIATVVKIAVINKTVRLISFCCFDDFLLITAIERFHAIDVTGWAECFTPPPLFSKILI